jgi:hypothetical protein
MPNWCQNRVTISHKDEEKLAGLYKAMSDENNEYPFCGYVIPVPKGLQETEMSFYMEPHLYVLEKMKQESNLKKYGYKDWYDFCVANWGTKWDVSEMNVAMDGTKIVASFDTAWAPPGKVYERLHELGFKVCAHYYESGCCFVGTWCDGHDTYYNICDENAETVRGVIGAELDDLFHISEDMLDIEALLTLKAIWSEKKLI